LDKELISYLVERDDITQLGYVDRNTLLEYLYNSKALIMPSEYEGFGIPPLEALYLGKPVIVSDIEVFKEIYKDLPVAFFKSKDFYSLKDELLNLSSNINFENVRLLINKKYSYMESAIKIKDLIKFYLE